MKIMCVVKPQSQKSRVVACEESADGIVLRVALRAVPENGRANKELIEVLSDFFKIPRSDIEISSGHSAKKKILRLDVSLNNERDIVEKCLSMVQSVMDF